MSQRKHTPLTVSEMQVVGSKSCHLACLASFPLRQFSEGSTFLKSPVHESGVEPTWDLTCFLFSDFPKSEVQIH